MPAALNALCRASINLNFRLLCLYPRESGNFDEQYCLHAALIQRSTCVSWRIVTLTARETQEEKKHNNSEYAREQGVTSPVSINDSDQRL
jgi:hypothetical protein